MRAHLVPLSICLAVSLACVDPEPENRAPVAVDDVGTTAEDVALRLSPSDNDSDPDGDELSLGIVAVTQGSAALNEDGTVTFTPAADFAGTASITYSLTDGTAEAEAEILITVTAVNDAPVANADPVTAAEDGSLQLPVATLIANDSDIEGDPLTLVGVGAASAGLVSLSEGVVTFAPPADFVGETAFEYTLSDGALESVGTVTVTVTPVNDAPTALADLVTTPEDAAVAFSPAENDQDIDGDPLTTVAVLAAEHGSASLGAAGAITFTPAANFTGAATVSYSVSDGELTAVGEVTIDVTPLDDAPIAVDDAVSGDEDAPLELSPAENDTEVDGDSLAVTEVFGVMNGTAELLAGGVVRFIPAADFVGPASFDYTITDGVLTDTGHVAITVTAVNDPPVASNDSAAVAEDATLELTAATLLANDTDLDGDPLQILEVGTPVNGSVELISGDVRFVPSPDFVGQASFTYFASDGALAHAALVEITVSAVDDAPVAVTDRVSTEVEDPVIVSPLENDLDLDGDGLEVIAVGNVANGTATLLNPNTVSFVPADGFGGVATFEYTVSDGISSAVGQAEITVFQCGNGSIETGVPTAISFAYLASACGESSSVRFLVNGVEVASGPIPGECNCETPAETVIVTDRSALALLQPGDNTFAVEFSGGASVSWAVGTLVAGTRAEERVLVDAHPGNPLDFPEARCLGFEVDSSGSAELPVPTEACDDGANVNGDGCNAVCGVEFCGDGIHQPALNEGCDDGNEAAGDGCEPGCSRICGPDVASEAWLVADTCYFGFRRSEPWDDARARCVTSGVDADLVTVDDAAENAWLAATRPGWIGLNDQGGNEGLFEWSSGAPVNYVSWAPGEPNNDFEEDCVALTSAGQWNDLSCTLSRHYLCEAP